jgi:hypothetical protein
VLTDGNTDYKLFQVTVTYVGASPLVDNINVGVFIQYSYGGSLSNFAGFQIPINGQEGQTQNSTVYDTGKIGFVAVITSNLGPLSYQLGGGTGTGGTSTYNTFISSSLEAVDQGHFRVHVSQSNVLIAPKVMSEFYYGVVSGSYTSDGFYFNGIDSSLPTYGEADYPFILNPGDLIRLYNTGSSAQGFSTLEEYEITSIHTPASTNDSMSFSLNKNIDLGTIQSFSANSLTGSITRYIISRKIPDETNIVIDYQKRDGQTSAGVVKNTNLASDIDAKMANIVSDLKSKIFSTVLIP